MTTPSNTLLLKGLTKKTHKENMENLFFHSSVLWQHPGELQPEFNAWNKIPWVDWTKNIGTGRLLEWFVADNNTWSVSPKSDIMIHLDMISRQMHMQVIHTASNRNDAEETQPIRFIFPDMIISHEECIRKADIFLNNAEKCLLMNKDGKTERIDKHCIFKPVFRNLFLLRINGEHIFSSRLTDLVDQLRKMDLEQYPPNITMMFYMNGCIYYNELLNGADEYDKIAPEFEALMRLETSKVSLALPFRQKLHYGDLLPLIPDVLFAGKNYSNDKKLKKASEFILFVNKQVQKSFEKWLKIKGKDIQAEKKILPVRLYFTDRNMTGIQRAVSSMYPENYGLLLRAPSDAIPSSETEMETFIEEFLFWLAQTKLTIGLRWCHCASLT